MEVIMTKFASLFAAPALAIFLLATASPTQMPTNPFGVTIAPKNGQTAEQQATDESACYQAAKTKSGFDPATLQEASTPASGSSDALTTAALNAVGGSSG